MPGRNLHVPRAERPQYVGIVLLNTGIHFHFFFCRFKKGSCKLLAKVCALTSGNRLGKEYCHRPDMTMHNLL